MASSWLSATNPAPRDEVVAGTRSGTPASELAARMVAATFGGVSALIGVAGLTAPWRGSTDTPAIAIVLLSIPMLILAAAFAVAAFWRPRELSRRAIAMLIACELAGAAAFALALHLHAFGGP